MSPNFFWVGFNFFWERGAKNLKEKKSSLFHNFLSFKFNYFFFWGGALIFIVSVFQGFRVFDFLSDQLSGVLNYRVSKFPSFQRWEGRRTNERLGTYNVT